jgi:hypothetical protein
MPARPRTAEAASTFLKQDKPLKTAMIDPATRNDLLERAEEARRAAEQMHDAEARAELNRLGDLLHRLANTWVIEPKSKWLH